MASHTDVLLACPLFSGIAEAELDDLLCRLAAHPHKYMRDACIFHLGAPANFIGIVLQGGVQVIREDCWGNRSILAQLGPGDLFGEAFACVGEKHLPVGVVATQDSTILLADYRKVVTPCPNSGTFHAQLIQNMLDILAQKNIMLNQKIDILSRRTTREKLLAYLAVQARAAGAPGFTIPFNRQQLADYLGVDRSAMSSELSRLQKDGILSFERNHFRFLTLPGTFDSGNAVAMDTERTSAE